MKPSVIAITMGDPGGIGPEIIAKTFRKFCGSRRFYYVLFGSRAPFLFLKNKFGLTFPTHFISSLNRRHLSSQKINFLEIGDSDFDKAKVSLRNAQLTQAALQKAAKAAAQGKVDAIVTAPVNKTTMRLVDSHFHGHTEFLAETSQTKHFAMMFVSPRLKVTLVTIHEPIRKLSGLIHQENVFQKIRLTHEFLKKRFKMRSPRLGVCALNPHGRETGTEDEAEIRPAVRKAVSKGIQAFGPLSADQIFHDAYEGRFDAVISMYHDQGLAPFKMISFRDGVNVTLGLPYVRTSPDHGTAFDIAYKNRAEAASFEASLRLAEKFLS